MKEKCSGILLRRCTKHHLGLDGIWPSSSFCIHARNLYDFLRHEGGKSTNIRADSYVPGHAKPNANVDFNKLDTFLFHMSKGRIDKKKVDLVSAGPWKMA